MRHLARLFLATTLLSLLGLAPLPAHAAVATLDVVLTPLTGETISPTGDTVDRVTADADCAPAATDPATPDDCIQVLTASVDDAGPVDMAEVSFEFVGGPSDPDGMLDDSGSPIGPSPDVSCTTDATGDCSISFHSSEEGQDKVVAWIEEGPLPVGDEAEMDEATAPDDADGTDVVEVGWYDGVLNVYATLGPPENEERSAAPSTEVKFEASVVEAEPTAPAPAKTLLANVDAEILATTSPPSPNADKQATKPDMECFTLPTTGKCELKYSAGTTTGVDTIRSWIDRNENPNAATPTGDEEPGAATGYEGDDTEQLGTEGTDADKAPITDVVKASISSNPQLSAAPVTQTKQTGTTALITASLTLAGVGENAKKIGAVVLPGGPNAGKALSCNTGSGGTCDIQYSSAAVGVDKLRLWADTDGDGQPDEADTGESEPGATGSTPEPDTTTVVQVTWQAPTPDDGGGGDDTAKCDQAKAKLKKAKKALKKAKASGDEDRIKRAKKRVKRAKRRKIAACAGVA